MAAIPQEAIDMALARGSVLPGAGEDDVRHAMLEANAGPAREACPACQPCTLCAGLGAVDPETAFHWRVRNATTGEMATVEEPPSRVEK